MDRYGLICRSIWENPAITQRELAQILDVSLGTVNNLMKECIQKGYISPSANDSGQSVLLPAGKELLESYKVDGAVILAAGFGSRFVPLTFETPKGLLKVFGERMIERQIRQLREAGIEDITVVVGYLKEKFEYLIDKYQVKLLYNPEYSCKNTLATVYHARKLLQGRVNGYVISLDMDATVLEKTDQYTIQKKYDQEMGTDYLESWGTMDGGYYFLMRIPAESIRDSVRISNDFIKYIAPIVITIETTLFFDFLQHNAYTDTPSIALKIIVEA